MTRRALGLVGLLAVFLLSCAEGFGSGDNISIGLNNGGAAGSGSGGTGATSGGTGGMSGGTGGGSGGTYTGMPCTQGDKVDCTCATGGMGTQMCTYDASSPSG